MMKILSRKDYLMKLPDRPQDSHKGTFGHVLVIGGSPQISGAAYLNAYAAYMVGAGLVKIYTAKENREILAGLLPEALLSTYDAFQEEELTQELDWADIICIGSGLGTEALAEQIFQFVVTHSEKPLIIDADGLNILSHHQELYRCLSKIPCVLTPHLKEMSRLIGYPVSEIKEKRVPLLSDFLKSYGIITVLKDSTTFIFCKDERIVQNISGNSCMAKGGSGDVLTGIIGGLMAQGASPEDAAILGVYIHGLAGDLAKEMYGSYSVLARDLIEQSRYVLKQMEDENRISC